MVVDSQEDSWESDDYKEERDDDLEIDDKVHEIMDFGFGVKVILKRLIQQFKYSLLPCCTLVALV